MKYFHGLISWEYYLKKTTYQHTPCTHNHVTCKHKPAARMLGPVFMTSRVSMVLNVQCSCWFKLDSWKDAISPVTPLMDENGDLRWRYDDASTLRRGYVKVPVTLRVLSVAPFPSTSWMLTQKRTLKERKYITLPENLRLKNGII